MFKRISVLTLSVLCALALVVPVVLASARPATVIAAPGTLYTGPITILASNVATTTYTTTARYCGDAAYIDAYLGSAGTGNVTAILYTSSNASDWARSVGAAITSSGAATVTRYTAYGAYYRFIVTTDASITPTLRIVQKP